MRLVAPLLVGAALGAATPPALVPSGGLLVWPALMGLYALARRGEGAARACYLAGAIHVAVFSLSLRHVSWLFFVAVTLVGGLYYALIAGVVRRRPAWLWPPLAFALALAATQRLRAVMPEIYYPHGQPAHCLYEWLALLGPVPWGGTVLLNAVLGFTAAALLEALRGRGAGRRRAVIAAAAAAGVHLASGLWCPRAEASAGSVRITALEPGLGPLYAANPDVAETVHQRLVVPTALSARQQPPPDLVLWPESTFFYAFVRESGSGWTLDPAWRPPIAKDTRLVAGTSARFGSGDELRDVPAALVIDHSGAVLGSYEKRRLVPFGEFIPLAGLLPRSVHRQLLDYAVRVFGTAPGCSPGRRHPLPATAGGVPFGVLMCYDNAFPEIAEEQVAAGARVLVVLSNEAWFRRGGELEQMHAHTVFRALETSTPLVRSTLDGPTLAVGADGRLLGVLPWIDAPRAPRQLEVDVALGPGVASPMAWPRTILRWAILAVLLIPAWHRLRFRARLA